ncbi:hypothetical protein AcV7_000178 [Taiwanofungus camphoratus]|nr:hypothetical protein AcV7_000178 [Antrodia cinnamomea]
MSSNATIIAEEEILVAQNFVNNYCTLATCTLILYEHTTTFSQEALLIWGAKTTGATIVFILNRYLLFAYGVILALEVIPWSTPKRLLSSIDGHVIDSLSISFTQLWCYILHR